MVIHFQPYMCDTLNIAPGQRFDALIDCQEPGAWAFHCHILTHAESSKGMFGIVTALVINSNKTIELTRFELHAVA